MKKVAVLTGICLVVIVAYLQLKTKNRNGDPRGTGYAGDLACNNCHKNVYDNYLHTAHYKASLPASENTIKGSFSNGMNTFIVNDSQKMVMEHLDNKLFQTYYLNGQVRERYRFDIVFGGVKGESYLYWKGNELYQLPISFYNGEHKWSTSPGYGFNFLDYPRLRFIGKQCLECHASYIESFPGKLKEQNSEEHFDKETLVYSVNCERCHGPGQQHVDFQTRHPEVKTAAFMTSYNSLNRIQRLDMCGVCHAGKPIVKIRSTFAFLPGDTLANFKVPDLYSRVDSTHLDVHGNQIQLLRSSKCYLKSNLDCATCHDVHQDSRNKNILYAEKCQNCHNAPGHVFCKMSDKIKPELLIENCVSCHMPALPTKVISVQVSDKTPGIQFFVHTHRIATYPEEVKKVLAYIKN